MKELRQMIPLIPFARNKFIFGRAKAPKIDDLKWRCIDLILRHLRSSIYRQLSRRPNVNLFLANGIILGIFFPLSAWASYSLADSKGISLDQKILKIMNFRHGVFVEAGAHDGTTQSNTKLLEETLGWTGILVEPSANLFATLTASRPKSRCFQCALGSFDEDGTYAHGDFDGNLMSSIHGTRLCRVPKQEVLIRSLQSILEEVGSKHVNFFSLDAEGYELNILKGIDFTKTTFDFILVELYNREYEEAVSFLSSKGYAVVENLSNYNTQFNPGWDKTHNDYLFKREGHAP